MAGIGPSLRRWTRDEFYRMAELGMFRGQRVELLGGKIVVLSPQKFPHAAVTDKVAEVLRGVFGPGFWVRAQQPLNLGRHSEPEPDVSVVAGRREDYADHPTAAVLVVEVSDTTLHYDRGRKGSRYTRAGIPDYWIVNLKRGQLEIHRNPVADKTQPFGFRYADVSIRTPPGPVSPLGLPGSTVEIADLFL